MNSKYEFCMTTLLIEIPAALLSARPCFSFSLMTITSS